MHIQSNKKLQATWKFAFYQDFLTPFELCKFGTSQTSKFIKTTDSCPVNRQSERSSFTFLQHIGQTE